MNKKDIETFLTRMKEINAIAKQNDAKQNQEYMDKKIYHK